MNCTDFGAASLCVDAGLPSISIFCASTLLAIASTELGNCSTIGLASWHMSAGSLRGSKTVRCSASEYNPHDGVEATVVDTMVQSTDASAIEWNVTVTSDASFFWTAPIITRIVLPAYDDNATSIWLGGVLSNTALSASFDPLEPFRLGSACSERSCVLPYGGEYARVQRGVPGEVWAPALELAAGLLDARQPYGRTMSRASLWPAVPLEPLLPLLHRCPPPSLCHAHTYMYAHTHICLLTH